MTTTTPTRPIATAADLLEAAADRIAVYGHNKVGYACYDTPDDLTKVACCMVGAIRVSAGLTTKTLVDRGHDDMPPLVREAEEILAEQVYQASGKGIWDGDDFDPVETVAEWNDAPNCDGDSAVAMLRDAAELAR